jgi:ionotropic glutamate receptor NMDA 2B
LVQPSSRKTNFQENTIQFNENRVINNAEFKIWNLNKNFDWKHVGSWKNKQIQMEDIVWPGKSHKPPLGKPLKFHMKIVTLEEPPFVIFKDQIDGICSSNSVLVRVSSDNNRFIL